MRTYCPLKVRVGTVLAATAGVQGSIFSQYGIISNFRTSNSTLGFLRALQFTFQNYSDLSLGFTVLSPSTSEISNTLAEFCGAEQTLVNIKCFCLKSSTILHTKETKCYQGGLSTSIKPICVTVPLFSLWICLNIVLYQSFDLSVFCWKNKYSRKSSQT